MIIDKQCITQEAEGSKTNLYTYNVWGLRDKIKLNWIFEYLRINMKGIVFLQETHSVLGYQSLWECEWQRKVHLSLGTSNSKGIAILLLNKMDSIIHEIKANEKERYIMLKGVFDGQELTLLNLYAPTADKV